MNRIYNVIWSKAKKCYVVVSELVKNGGGKNRSVHTGTLWARMSVIMAVTVLLAGINIGTVNAALIINGASGGYATGRDQYSSSNYLYNYKNPGNMAALDGSGSASGYYTTTSFSGVALGANADIKETGDPSAYSGVAVGSYAKATGGLAYAIGSYAQATNSSSMAIGTATLSRGFNSLAMMRQSAATKDFSTAIGTAAWADGVGSFAMGYSATAKGEQSIAIGAAETKKLAGQGNRPSAEYNGDGNTVTEGARSLAFGTTARTTSAASDSMAFGSKANTSGANAVAMGYNAQAKATDSFAIGNTAVSTGTGATAMGKSAQATGTSSFALGSGSSAAGTDSIAMGSSSLAKMTNSIALGGNAKSQGADALAIGGAANAGNTGAIALGKGAQAVSANSTAIGSGATVTGANAMAIGTNAKASTPNSLALGSGTEITKTLTDGYSAFTNEINHNYVMGVVAVGNDGVGRRITNVAGGEDDTDAANIKQLKYVNSNLAQSIAGSSYTGYEANGSTYKAPDFNIKNSTYHTVKEAVEAAQTNFFSAKGDSSDANYDNTGATGTNATAAGVRTSAAGNYGTAVGADASATNANSTAIGYKAKSSVNDGVALGSDSVASVAAGKTGYNVGTANSRTNTYSGLTGAALTSALGAVSVGDGGTKTRQITNVAAGTADTDAVNVAQLRNVNLKVAGNTNANGGRNDVLLDNQTLMVKGDGTYITTTANNQTIDVALTDATKKKIDNAADKDLSNITDTAKKNITSLGTVVQAGNNVTIGAPVVDSVTGQKTYTVNGMDTKVSLGTSGLMTLSGGTPDTNGVRNYIVDVDPAKVAKTDLSNITNDGKTVIQEEAKKSVKVIAGKNTVITEGVDGTYKTYKVDVDAPDYQLVENSGAADKAYTVSGNKVDLTVQDAKNPADKKTVTIKDIASKTELDKVQDRSVKYDGAADKGTVTLEGVGGTKITNLKDGLIASGSKEAVNGGQLHDVKNELNTAITNTKNEVIGKGLRFDADNNSEKTNKLGSKVAVNGDSNITTEITQSGDDTKIGIKLNQDLNVKTVTAVDTVKAGGVTVGKQADGTNPTVGNYVTGLDNKNWDASNIVSGRAATEDQLKKALDKQSADATDYRLIRNQATGSNGDYTVDGNGDVALTVQDKNHTDKTETVTIKDVASKSAMDKGLNFAGDTGTASNRKLGETVTVKGGATGTLSDGNIGVVSDGNGTLNVKLAKTLTGLDSVTAGGTTINSSGLTVGGKTYVSSNGIDANSQKITNVADGNVASGSKEAVNGGQLHQVKQDLGDQITNTTNTINNKIDTTKQDLIDKGLQFDADNHDAKTNKLGSRITVTGDGTNISTAVTQSGDDTTIKVALGQDINVNTVTAIKTVKAGTAVMGNQSVTDNKAAAQAGNFVTGLDNKSWTISDPVYVSGRAATEDQLKTVSDAVKAANASATDYRLIGDPNNAVDGSYKVDNNRVDLKVKDDKTGTVNTVTIKDIASKTELDKVQDRSVKYDGTAGKDTVTLEGVNGTKITNLQDGNVAPGSKDAVNGGQLHDAKNELNTNINNAKTELTNTGLRFDADNNSEKTNKLGSKVTVNGDNNITTNITQTGDDTKIGVTLNKDLNVTTLTAADTVKAGTVTMGKQTDGANPANTGNYVTGLANKDWSVTNPTAVSGRAATEDQLKTVTEAVKMQGANATDFRLVKNAAAADGAYTVDSNGDVELTVEDKNHTDKKETVTIKDVASKSAVDTLTDRAVKYDADNSGNVDKTKVTYEGPAYANKIGGTHVTNVAYATGNDGSEAVNVDYLKDRIKDSETTITDKGLKFDANNGGEKTNKLGSKVTVKGDNANIITEISQDGNGDSTIDVKLGKDLKTETITATGANGKDGKIGINGKDGVTTNISVTRDGQPGVDGAAGTTTTRIVYQKPDGTNEEVATLNDGLKVKGDMGATSNVKLNKQVDITGGVTSASDLATGNNIGVTSAVVDADGNAKLQLQLAKNLTGLQSVTASDTVKAGTAAMGNQSVTDNKSAAQAGNFVTGLDNKTWTMSDPAYVSGRAATEDQLKTVSDAVKAANASATDYRLVENANAADKAYTADASGNIKLTVEDKNHAGQTETVTIKDVASKSAMDKGLNFDGDSGATINKKLGDTVAVKGGADTSKLADGNIGVVSDGNGTLNVKLAKTLTGLDSVTAGGTTMDSNGLTVGGKTYVSSNGINANDQKITNVADGNVAAGSKEAVNGGQLHQVKQDLGDQITDTTNTINNKIDATKQDLINTGLKFDANVGGEQTNKLGSKVTVKGEGNAADTDYSGENIKTFITQDASGNTTIDVKMNKNVVADTIKVNKNGKDGKDGVSITGPAGVAGQDGNNGKVGITGADGKDAVSMSGKDGVGHIGLTGPAGTNGVNGTNGIDISVKNGYDDAGKGVKGEKGVDGADGITRIVYQDKNGEHQVATMEDGLQFTGNNTGTVNKQKLNSLVKIQGEGVTETASGTFTSASGNINVKANGTDTLELQLAKDLKNLDSVTATKTVKASTVTMGDQTVTNTKGTAETGNYVTGLDNTDWAADKIVSGRAATEDQLKKALDKQSADATDYRLIRNQATGSNGDYTVDGNGDVALTVQDKNHTDKTETVTIKDVASKSAVDKLTDRAVKYALDGSGSPDKTKVAYEGPAYTNKTGGTHVTNVAYAAGTDGSEAVNVDYLNDKIKANADTLTDTGLKFDANTGGEKTNKLGSKVTVKGEGNAADTDYSGENIKTFITQDASGNTTIDVKMNKNVVADTIKVNKNGKDGKDGVSITGPAGVAGQDGNNGKVGITGADGKDAVSMSGKDGVGHIGLTGPAGTNGVNGTNGIDISVKNGYDDAGKGVKGEKGVDGADGITRIVYQDKNGEHQVATMDDGMLYGGDGGTVIKKKLNNQVNIKGGISDESKLSTDANIGVMSDGTDTLMLRLAKDLKGLNSATFNNGTNGTTVVNGGGMSINDAAGNPLTSVTKDGVTITNGPSMTTGGIDAANKQIINVADGKVETGSKDAVNGGQLADQIESVTKSITEKGFGLTAEDGQTVKKSLGETVTVKGDGTNIKTSVDNGIVKVELKKDINVDTVRANKVTTGNTTMDTNGVTIKDGTNEAAKLTKDGLQINDGGNKAVTVNKDGLTIENGPKVTKDGIDAADKKITNVADGTVGAGSKDAVNGGQLHTAIEDIKSAGFGLTAEDGQSVKKPLGSTIDLKGDGNIKTSVDGDAVKISLNDKLTIGQDPAKQVKVDGATGSVTAGDGTKQVKMDGAAGTITAGSGVNRVKVDGNDGSVTANTVKAGDVVAGRQSSGGQTGNFVTGLDNKTWNADNPAAVTGRAATEDQLKAVNDDFNNKAKTGRVFQGDQSGDDGKVVRGLGDTMNLTGGADVNRLTDNNIGVVKNSAGDGYNIKLAKDINMGDGSTSYTKAVAGTNTTVPYTVQTKVDGQGVTITPSVNGRPVSNHTVSLTENGLNNGNNTITNVAPGVNGTDAVNVNQLSSVMRNMDGKVADVGAASAAISGLKPLQYDPLEPTQVLAAVGHYKGSTAAAVGLAHYTNESTMFHMGVSIGGHDNMVNAGVSYKFGTSDAKKAVPERYKGGPISSMYVMQDEMTALKAENERMKKHDEELTAKYDQVQRDNEEMKAQIALLIQKAGIKK